MSTPRDRIEAKLGLGGPPLRRVRDAPPRVPDHELIRRIGQGSYGEVWLARNALGTWRAVKIVYRDSFKDARPYEREFAGIRRFEPLSRANEGLVDILQVGRDDAEGWFYYVMELADGAENPKPETRDPKEIRDPKSEDATVTQSVRLSGFGLPSDFDIRNSDLYQPRTLSRDLQQRGRLPLEDCLQLGLTLSLALGHLHRHGLIHRDVKPSNIIFVGGVPKLADIGLVTEASGANTFVGTEGFVPPEGPTSPQADIYALGKVLYEAAMGKDRNEFPEPFTQISTDRESVALMELNSILLRACAPDPKARYASAEEMHADLALLHSGGSVKRRHQFERQFRIAKQVGALAIAAVLMVGAAWFWQREQTQKITRLADEKVALATEKTRLADNLTKLDAENRNRIVRLDIANGNRLLDEANPAAALLWFADALPLMTNKPAEEAIHRIRIQQTLDQTPRVLRVFPHEADLTSSVFSPDGRFIVTGDINGNIRVWNAEEVALVWGPKPMEAVPYFVRYSRDGKRLFVSSSLEQRHFNGGIPFRNFFAVLDAGSGREVFSSAKLLSGASTNLVCAHFSPDERWLAVSERNNPIRVFDLANGGQVAEFRGHTGEVEFFSFSADGNLLASASLDRTARLWRLPTGKPVGPPLEHRWPVVRALLTDDGEHLITASFARTGASLPGEDRESEVQAWNVLAGARSGERIATGGWVSMFVAPGQSGKFLVHGRAYDFGAPKAALFSVDLAGLIHSWDFAKDGSRLALGGGEYLARVFDARTGVPLTEPFRHPGPEVIAVQFSPKADQLLTASVDGNARLLDLRSAPAQSARQTLPATITEGQNPIKLGQPSGRIPIRLKDGTVLVVGDRLEELHRFPLPDPKATADFVFCGRHSNIWSCRYRVGTNEPTAILLWREDGQGVQRYNLEHPKRVHAQYFTADDRYVLSYCEDRLVRFWRTSDGILERTAEVPAKVDGDLIGLSPDGRTALWDQSAPPGIQGQWSVQFMDLETGKFIGPIFNQPATVFEASFSPDGRQLAFLDSNGAVTIREPRTGRVISTTIRHSSNLIWVEWDPEGRRVLTAGHNDEVLVWDVETGVQLLGPLRTPGGIARIAHWSPDGRFIVTRGDDKRVRVWDATTGEAVTPFWTHSGEVVFAIMTPDHRVITASEPDQLRAWDLKESALPPDVLADYAKLLSGRRLSPTGAMLVMKPEELAGLNRSLRIRARQLFE